MFNQAFFVRILIAVLVAVILIAVVPVFLRVIGFPVTGDVSLIIKSVIAIAALFYVFKGN